VERVSGTEASPSISKVLERAAIARTADVVAGLEKIRVGMGQR
jgi:2-oxoisovalerate dehydrogenase E1 component